MEENKNTGSCLVHYTIAPAVRVEGDEDDNEMLYQVMAAIETGVAVYAGFTFPEMPERLVTGAADTTDIVFTVNVAGLTPFNGEHDFKAGIIAALQHGDGEITEGLYYEDDVKVKRLDITLVNEI